MREKAPARDFLSNGFISLKSPVFMKLMSACAREKKRTETTYLHSLRQDRCHPTKNLLYKTCAQCSVEIQKDVKVYHTASPSPHTHEWSGRALGLHVVSLIRISERNIGEPFHWDVF
ncbi:unnamed protein product [Timema podura]|uniref:Uncharacterized protein n=1 Tax=Timema podura TaxID=61482 RepID=A0ABN7P3C7_TIMPD|nr:unnamed protein product [Timema podura]